MALPNFMIIGAPKCGTTTLAQLLDQHPDVFMSPEKEARYFVYSPDDTRKYIRDTPYKTLDEYHAAFQGVTVETVIGEATPIYFYSPPALGRIRELISDVKLVLILRNPVDRLFSEAQHLFRDGNLDQEEFERFHQIPRLVNLGFYAEHFRTCLEIFERPQVKVLLFEHLVRQPERLLQSLCDFLGIDVQPILGKVPRANVGGVPVSNLSYIGLKIGRSLKESPAIPAGLIDSLQKIGKRFLYRRVTLDPTVREQLMGHYAADIELLEELSGEPVTRLWLEDPVSK